jgi:class 3 adenylate cyclase
VNRQRENSGRLGRQAFEALVAEELAGPARAILGYQALVVEQARELGRDDLLDDLDKVSAAAATLDRLIAVLVVGDERSPEDEARLRHDLRTPLNAIIGYSEMIAEDLGEDDPNGLSRDLAVILAEARGLEARVDAIVDYRRAAAMDTAARRVAAGLASTLDGPVVARGQEPGRILVVDDVATNRDLLRRRLARDGHEVLLAGSGAEALACLDCEEVDVVLLDILMPDMNGIEVLTRLRDDPRRARLLVIMISGLKETDAVIRCIEAGADDYLTTPFNPVLLRARVNASLERKRWADREARYLQRIELERDRADALLHAVLPAPVVLRLSGGEEVIADRFEEVSIIFADLVGFSAVAAQTPASDLVRRLDRIFSAFDGLAEEHGVEKIKTIGDAYMAAAGVPHACADHADRVMRLAWSMLGAMEASDPGPVPFRLRIGVHTGPVVAGLIGRRRFVYDVWGETVNIASRLESHGAPGTIQISQATFGLLTERWDTAPAGAVDLKGMGAMPAWRVAWP